MRYDEEMLNGSELIYSEKVLLGLEKNQKVLCQLKVGILCRSGQYGLAQLPCPTDDEDTCFPHDPVLLTRFEYDALYHMSEVGIDGFFVGYSGGQCCLLRLSAKPPDVEGGAVRIVCKQVSALAYDHIRWSGWHTLVLFTQNYQQIYDIRTQEISDPYEVKGVLRLSWEQRDFLKKRWRTMRDSVLAWRYRPQKERPKVYHSHPFDDLDTFRNACQVPGITIVFGPPRIGKYAAVSFLGGTPSTVYLDEAFNRPNAALIARNFEYLNMRRLLNDPFAMRKLRKNAAEKQVFLLVNTSERLRSCVERSGKHLRITDVLRMGCGCWFADHLVLHRDKYYDAQIPDYSAIAHTMEVKVWKAGRKRTFYLPCQDAKAADSVSLIELGWDALEIK